MVDWLKRVWGEQPRMIRLRQPARFQLVAGAETERIEATFDAGGRLLSLTVHTRSRSLRER